VGPDDPVEAEIRRTLEKEESFQFADAVLEDVVEFLRKITKVNILIDKRALDDIGVGTDTPITFQAQRMKVRDALAHILRPLGATWEIRDQILLITSQELSEADLLTRLYPVADLLGRPEGVDAFGDPQRPARFEELATFITQAIIPESWDKTGGRGSIDHLRHIDVLIISQTQEAHEQIATLLGKVRSSLPRPSAGPAAEKRRPQNEPTRVVIYYVPTATQTPQATAPGKPGEPNATPQAEASPRPPRLLAAVNGGNAGLPPVRSLAPIPEDTLVDLIRELIEPESWKNRSDVYVKAVPNRLIIRQTAAVHRQIRELFRRLGLAAGPLDTHLDNIQGAVGGVSPGPGGGMF